MEPISIIITALSAGAIAAAKETAGTAVKDTYQGLKTLIKKKFEGDVLGQAINPNLNLGKIRSHFRTTSGAMPAAGYANALIEEKFHWYTQRNF